MKSMAFWAGIGALVGFSLLWAVFSAVTEARGPERGLWSAFSIMGAIPAAAIGAGFAAVSIIRKELRETGRAIRHWQSIQHLDEELNKESTHIKPAPLSGHP